MSCKTMRTVRPWGDLEVIEKAEHEREKDMREEKNLPGIFM